MEKDFFVIDLEFTQYTKRVGRPRAFFSEIIEIGAVKIAWDTKDIIGEIKYFVKPHFFPKHAVEGMAFSMITTSDMKGAIDFSAMLHHINSLYIPDKTYFVTWGDADYSVIAQGCERHMLPNPILLEDCLDLAAAYKVLKNDTNTTGLRNAALELAVDADGMWHTAYDDAFNTARILLKLIADGWKPEHYFSTKNQLDFL